VRTGEYGLPAGTRSTRGTAARTPVLRPRTPAHRR
jgi:hypothetical protein